ncbi:MAG: hypothetical protein JOY85_25940 [Acidobacteriaceae bacterium]|nr:hypothetical protein [Acidobacteriaceae bacterium]
MPDVLVLLGRTCLHFVLLMLLFLAACAFAIRKNVRDIPSVGLIGLAGTALPGYFVFWSWFVSRRLVHPFATAVLAVAALWLLYFFRFSNREARDILKALSFPFCLIFTSSLLVLSTGFVYGGMQDPLVAPKVRFSHELPGDNAIPFIFLESMLTSRHIPRPIMANYNSSDRPPLQTAIALSQTPLLIVPRPLAYTILSAVLQSFWIFALWILLFARGVSTGATRCALLACLLSQFVFLNTFYVWPKLIAAAYILGFITALLTGRLDSVPHQRLLSVAAGCLLTWGMLSHGSSVFAVLGIPLTMWLFRRSVSLKALLMIGATAFILYLPWIVYQKFYDPPGDRLLKMHIAGVPEPDPRSFTQALVSAYRSLNAGKIVSNKWENFKSAFGYAGDYFQTVAKLLLSSGKADGGAARNGIARALRTQWFLRFIPNLGLLMVGLPALLAGIGMRQHSPEWQSAILLLALILIINAIWCLLMFGPASTIIHQGTYVTVPLAFTGCVLALWTVSKWLAIVITILQISVQAFVSLWLLHPAGQLQYGMVTLSLIGLAATLLLLRKLPSS